MLIKYKFIYFLISHPLNVLQFYFYSNLHRELEGEGFEEIDELSENEIVEKQIINNDLNITYATGSLSKKETLNIKADLEKTLNSLDNLEKNISFEGFLLDGETRKAFKESLEHSMKMAKLIAKNKFSSKGKLAN
ncbi:hypothetical protein ACOT7R_14995 [Clostridium perfringens]|uniref:hypothetical protein n=1 Tax=Clostridium perfringens TaxID=1502 RepID=UPI003BA97809